MGRAFDWLDVRERAVRDKFLRDEREPKPGEKCRGCKEVVYDDHRYVNKNTGLITCGWCGYDHFADQHGGFMPAGGGNEG